MFKRTLTPRETEFLNKLRELFIEYNAMIFCNEDNEIAVCVDVSKLYEFNNDISFNDPFDDTDIDALLEDYDKELN